MTTQEIKDLIASKITGQGNQVDSGSALPEILNAIAEAADNANPILKLNGAFHDQSSQSETTISANSAEELAEALNNGMTAEEVERFVKGEYLLVKPTGGPHRWLFLNSGSIVDYLTSNGEHVRVIGEYELLIDIGV